MPDLMVSEMPERLRPFEPPDTVLVVDDDAVIRKMVRLLLECTDHVVLEARDGVEALEVARAHRGRIDLLLTDLEMPRMGGLELARLFAQHRPATPVVYMSAAASILRAGDAVTAGRPYLTKPLRAGRLIFTVREAIGSSGRAGRPTS